MSVIHLDKEDFNDIISNGKVVVDFFATWCGPCKMLGPVFEKVSDEVNDVKFVKLEIGVKSKSCTIILFKYISFKFCKFDNLLKFVKVSTFTFPVCQLN